VGEVCVLLRDPDGLLRAQDAWSWDGLAHAGLAGLGAVVLEALLGSEPGPRRGSGPRQAEGRD